MTGFRYLLHEADCEDVTITYDRYGHLMPGNEEVAAGLLDSYLGEARGAANALRA